MFVVWVYLWVCVWFSVSSFASQWMLQKGFPAKPAVLMEVSGMSERVGGG